MCFLSNHNIHNEELIFFKQMQPRISFSSEITKRSLCAKWKIALCYSINKSDSIKGF